MKCVDLLSDELILLKNNRMTLQHQLNKDR